MRRQRCIVNKEHKKHKNAFFSVQDQEKLSYTKIKRRQIVSAFFFLYLCYCWKFFNIDICAQALKICSMRKLVLDERSGRLIERSRLVRNLSKIWESLIKQIFYWTLTYLISKWSFILLWPLFQWGGLG